MSGLERPQLQYPLPTAQSPDLEDPGAGQSGQNCIKLDTFFFSPGPVWGLKAKACGCLASPFSILAQPGGLPTEGGLGKAHSWFEKVCYVQKSAWGSEEVAA